MSKDYYEILGVSKDASQDEIKSAYRKLAKKYHPDVSDDKEAEKKFNEVQEAYSVVGDENKRKQYDQYGSSAFDGSAGTGGFGGFGGFEGFSGVGFDFSDIFDNIFGGGFGSRSSNGPTKGRDQLLRIRLSFEEAVYGTEKELSLEINDDCEECHGKGGTGEKTCPDCHGSGTVTKEQRSLFGSFVTQTTCSTCNGKGKIYDKKCKSCNGTGNKRSHKTIVINVPKGVDTGDRLRMSGKGDAGLNGGPNGDLYLEFIVNEHEFYKRDGNDIILKVPITYTEAALGCKKEIPTINGVVKLSIPSGTNSLDKHRLKGKGIESDGRVGDMYVIIDVRVPSKLSREQKRILEELDKTVLEDINIEKFNKFMNKK